MKDFNPLGNLMRKRRVTIYDNNSEQWHTDISPATTIAASVAVIALIFGILLILVAYTPILDVLPGYRTNAVRSRELLVRSIVRIDSLERKMNDMLAYNENRILVVSGKTPTMRTTQSDSLRRDKSFVAPSKEDSLLRRQIENDERYRLVKGAAQSSQSNFDTTAPMYGIIAERFSGKDMLGVKIRGTKSAQVMAIAEGVVISSDWSPSEGHSIIVQHKDNFVSAYRNLSGSLISRGERVRGAQIIGYAGGGETAELSTLEFELWHDGKAINPELYIIF